MCSVIEAKGENEILEGDSAFKATHMVITTQTNTQSHSAHAESVATV